jgi:hypothetical protein
MPSAPALWYCPQQHTTLRDTRDTCERGGAPADLRGVWGGSWRDTSLTLRSHNGFYSLILSQSNAAWVLLMGE